MSAAPHDYGTSNRVLFFRAEVLNCDGHLHSDQGDLDRACCPPPHVPPHSTLDWGFTNYGHRYTDAIGQTCIDCNATPMHSLPQWLP